MIRAGQRTLPGARDSSTQIRAQEIQRARFCALDPERDNLQEHLRIICSCWSRRCWESAACSWRAAGGWSP